MNDGIGNASWLELFFIFLGLVAISYNWRNYRFYAGILRSIRKLHQNGFFLLQARKDRRHELERLSLQALLLTTGIIAAFLPEPQSPSVSLGRIISSVIVTGLQVGMMFSSYQDYRDNVQQNRYVSTPTATAQWDGSERREEV